MWSSVGLVAGLVCSPPWGFPVAGIALVCGAEGIGISFNYYIIHWLDKSNNKALNVENAGQINWYVN